MTPTNVAVDGDGLDIPIGEVRCDRVNAKRGGLHGAQQGRVVRYREREHRGPDAVLERGEQPEQQEEEGLVRNLQPQISHNIGFQAPTSPKSATRLESKHQPAPD